MKTLSLKIDQDPVADYEIPSEEEARTIVDRLIALSRSVWDYEDGLKKWTNGVHTMQIIES